ncbi:MAG: CHAT domain-containing protein [Bacteroidetes bacterium]|nr:CHAT domain-containing protein [Bacteroidota bacterium]MBU1720492.1 CHAT domain-containing protein [Bacteroidota bacterium]
MKRIAQILFAAFLPVLACAQEYNNTSPELSRRVDSLKRILNALPELNGTDADTTRMSLYFAIAKQYEMQNLDSAFLYYRDAVDTRIFDDGALNKTAIKENKGKHTLNATAHKMAGIILYYQGAFPQAKIYYGHALEIYEELSDKTGISACLNNLGLVCYNQGNYKEATAYYERSLKMDEESGDSAGVSKTLINIGLVSYLQGKYKEATSFYERSLRIDEEIGDQTRVSTNLVNLGIVWYIQGNLIEAVSYYKRSLKLFEESGDKRGVSACLNNLSLVCYEQGNYQEAIVFFDQSLELFEELGDKNGMSYCLMNIGLVYYNLNEYDKSLSFFERALAIFEELGDRIGISKDMINIGSLRYNQGNFSEAVSCFERALKIEQELGAMSDMATNYSSTARAYFRVGASGKALPMFKKSRELTFFLLQDNFSILSEKEKEVYLTKTSAVFNYINEYSLLMPENGSRSESCKDSLTGYCYNDELLLKGLLLNSTSGMMDAVSNSNDTALTNAYWMLKRYREYISAMQSSGEGDKKDNLDLLETLANEQERKLVKLSSDFAGLQQQFEYTWQDVQKNLLKNESAIEFVRIKHSLTRSDTCKTDSISFAALILRPEYEQPKMVALCNEQSLQDLMMNNELSDADFVGELYGKSKGTQLYELLWKPLEKYVAGVKNIYMAPVGMLHQIAFAAIPAPDGKLLLEKHSINLVSSTRVLIDGKKEELLAAGNAVVYGGIRYNADEMLAGELAAIHNAEKASIEQRFRNIDVTESWSYLPGTLAEAESIRKLLDISRKKGAPEQQPRGTPRLYSGVQATEESFKNLSGKAPEIIHIATHGFTIPSGDNNNAYKIFENSFVQNNNPLFRTGLLFAGANRTWSKAPPIEGIEDGILTAYEVSNMNLRNTKLVVLSACETGLGETKGSEGVYGLQRAFKAAGVHYIMMTLWTIPDEQTVELMSLFYSKLTSGETINHSFSFAQNEMKKKYSPYYWAGFVLVE